MNRRAMTAGFFVVLAMAGVAPHAEAQVRRRADAATTPAPRAAAPIEVRTSVSRTAVWLGDRLTYTIELRCAPGVDILVEDLAKERLPITGGEIVGVEAERSTGREGRTVHRMRFTLVTHQVDAAAITIAQTPVRYYAMAPGQRAGAAAPAGQVMVPPLVIAIRSTLPASGATIALRPPADLRPSPAYLRLAEPAGIALLLLAVLPLAIGSLDLGRRVRAFRARRHEHRARKAHRGSFDQLRDLEPASDTARIEAYDQLDAFVRDHLEASADITARSLTPEEVQAAIETRAPWLAPHDVGGLLDAFERARYDREPPTADDWREAVRRAGDIVTARR